MEAMEGVWYILVVIYVAGDLYFSQIAESEARASRVEIRNQLLRLEILVEELKNKNK